ncbi:uncharacterized protein LOC142609114 [Castanea sativa]|uniref:uncharacterized protein LOC142609114 n=1 Tax=Castanea sativa TaxID=21020 RepID=UPI003F64E463
MAVKLDISKAYDCVEWDFLRRVMMKLGFDERWVQLVMETVGTTTYLILINREPKGFVQTTRVIKQGDPLSLSRMIRKAAESHKPSVVWRSLLAAREVIFASSRWRVGDGSQILVASSNWTRSNILAIPLCYNQPKDKLIWKENSKHEFSIKTTYHVALRLRKQMVGEKLLKAKLEQWVVLSWAIWTTRNKFYFEKFQTPPKVIVEGALATLEICQQVAATQAST